MPEKSTKPTSSELAKDEPSKNDNEESVNWIPSFPMVINSPQDQGVTARVNTMENGYAVKTGGQAIFYSTAKDAADAVAAGIYETLIAFAKENK